MVHLIQLLVGCAVSLCAGWHLRSVVVRSTLAFDENDAYESGFKAGYEQQAHDLAR